MRVPDFQRMKDEKKPISMVTCYDFWSAQIINESPIDCILVGDSVAMIVHGYPTTISATIEMMATHTAAVSRGAPEKFIVGDMPFLSVRSSLVKAMEAVDALMKAGAQAVKIEGVSGHAEYIRHIVESGVPVMGHIGLTPQSLHRLGGFKVQGKSDTDADRLLREARQLQESGCFAVVLECVRSDVAEKISTSLTIPTIGIGAGPRTDGQVLVLQDLLDLFKNVEPRFVRHYLAGYQLLAQVLRDYDRDVKNRTFPSLEESYR